MNHDPSILLDMYDDPGLARSDVGREALCSAVQSELPLQHVMTSSLFEEFLFHPETQAALDARLEAVSPVPQHKHRLYRVRDALALGEVGLRRYARMHTPSVTVVADSLAEVMPEIPFVRQPPARLAGLLLPNLTRLPVMYMWDNRSLDSMIVDYNASAADFVGERGIDLVAGERPELQFAARNMLLEATATFFDAQSHATLQVAMRANGS